MFQGPNGGDDEQAGARYLWEGMISLPYYLDPQYQGGCYWVADEQVGNGYPFRDAVNPP